MQTDLWSRPPVHSALGPRHPLPNEAERAEARLRRQRASIPRYGQREPMIRGIKMLRKTRELSVRYRPCSR